MSAPGHSDRFGPARDPLPVCPENRRFAEYQERTPPLAKATGPTFGDARLLLLFHS